MPVVYLTVDKPWKPKKKAPFSARAEATQLLIKRLPRLVADSVNEVDGTALTKDNIVLRVQVDQGYSVNLANWWIDLQPEALDGTPQEREVRRLAIYDGLKKRINTFLRKKFLKKGYDKSWLPSFDIEIRPITGSGGSHEGGVETARWGATLPSATETDTPA